MLPSILGRKCFAAESKFLRILSIEASYIKSKCQALLQFHKLENFLQFCFKFSFHWECISDSFHDKSMVSISSSLILSVLQQKLYHIYKGLKSEISSVVGYGYFLELHNGCHSTSVDLGWVAKWLKTCVNLHANFILTKVSASHCKCMQGLPKLTC